MAEEAHAVCSNEAGYEAESQAVQTQTRSQGGDAGLGVIINNALRSENQKSSRQQGGGRAGLRAPVQ